MGAIFAHSWSKTTTHRWFRALFATVSVQQKGVYFGIHKVFCSSITLRKEEPSIANIIKHYWCIWRKKSQKMGTNEEKVPFHQDNAPCHKSITVMTKLHELYFKLLLHSSYSPDLAPSDYWLFADLKRMLQGKRSGSNKEVISETETYFEAKNKSFYKKDINC